MGSVLWYYQCTPPNNRTKRHHWHHGPSYQDDDAHTPRTVRGFLEVYCTCNRILRRTRGCDRFNVREANKYMYVFVQRMNNPFRCRSHRRIQVPATVPSYNKEIHVCHCTTKTYSNVNLTSRCMMYMILFSRGVSSYGVCCYLKRTYLIVYSHSWHDQVTY